MVGHSGLFVCDAFILLTAFCSVQDDLHLGFFSVVGTFDFEWWCHLDSYSSFGVENGTSCYLVCQLCVLSVLSGCAIRIDAFQFGWLLSSYAKYGASWFLVFQYAPLSILTVYAI